MDFTKQELQVSITILKIGNKKMTSSIMKQIEIIQIAEEEVLENEYDILGYILGNNHGLDFSKEGFRNLANKIHELDEYNEAYKRQKDNDTISMRVSDFITHIIVTKDDKLFRAFVQCTWIDKDKVEQIFL